MSETFKFKKFTISQDRCAMKVGTDGVLLGAWARGGKRVLDVGSGTGLVSLMMAQRFPLSKVEGVEIDHDAAVQSRENVMASPFNENVEIYESALQDFAPSDRYESIVSNPPFFVNSLASPDKARHIARHADTLPFGDLFAFVAEWLADDGEFSAIIPSDYMESFSSEAYLHGLILTRQYGIKTVERKLVKRYLLAFGKHRKSDYENMTVVLSKEGNKRSEWYENLTKDFYIH